MRRRLARWIRRLANWVDPPPFFERVRLGDGFATTPASTTRATGTTWTFSGGDSMGGRDD